MAILIDGYNLLHVTGIFSDAVGPGSVEKLHAKLLDFLAAALDPADVRQTTVVFDAKSRRAVARRSLEHSGITVHYAARHEEADDLLAELIRDHVAPRRLIVVSSDHQVQRAARRRRAKAIDSHVWYAELLRLRQERRQSATRPTDTKPAAPLSESDAAWWLAQFTPELIQELEQEMASHSDAAAKGPGAPPTAKVPTDSPTARAASAGPGTAAKRPPDTMDLDSLTDLFPPSYLESIQRELQSDFNAPTGTAPKPRPRKRRRGKRR